MLHSTSERCFSLVSQFPEALKCVDVVSPASLQEGYVFWAEWGDSSFPVKVPSGGVMVGQTLRVPLSDSRLSMRKGRWKDGIFSCFRFGIFHPHLWTAWLCPQILLGQILTRMNMTWVVKPASSHSSMPSLMRKFFLLLVMFTFFDAFLAPPLFEVAVDDQGDIILRENTNQRCYQVVYLLMSLPMSIYGVLVVVKLRAAVRLRYGIPTGKLGRLEDICCVCCCNCCVMSQLARQTANYGDEPAACCSATGVVRPWMRSDEDAIIPAIPI